MKIVHCVWVDQTSWQKQELGDDLVYKSKMTTNLTEDTVTIKYIYIWPTVLDNKISKQVSN